MVVLLALAPAALAIDPNRQMSQYVRERWGTERGFPRGPVYAITQTPDGYLWVGTEAGLVRFDGQRFQLVTPPAGEFNVASVLAIMPDEEGSLWLRLRGQELLRYRNGVFERLAQGAEVGSVTALARTPSGALLAAVADRGAMVLERGKFALRAASGLLPRSPVIAVAQTSAEELWMGTRDAGLFRFSEGKRRPLNGTLPDPKVNCLLPGASNELWAGTDQGVVHWDGTVLKTIPLGHSAGRLQALALSRDRDNNLWVGTDSRGLLRVNSRGVEALRIGEGGSAEAVTAVFEDREGNIWAGRSNGVERLRDSPFVTYSAPEGLPSDGSLPVYVDGNKRIWFPPASGGLWWFEDQRGRPVEAARLDGDVVYTMDGRDGTLWLGRKRGGLTRIDTTGGGLRSKTYSVADGLAQMSVSAVYWAKDGALWAGTLSGGLSRYANGKFETFRAANGLASNTVVAIAESADGGIWVATPNGVSEWRQGVWKTHTEGLPSINVNCLLVDAAGLVWAGTGSGVAVRRKDGFEKLAQGPAALRQPVFGMEQDALGYLWMATAQKVLRIERTRWLKGELTEADVREFGLADGLRGTEGVKRQRSVVRDNAGRIWFSLDQGISVVDPARLAGPTAPALARVQSVRADGVEIPITGTVRIPAGPRRIAIGYAGLSFSIPERVRFRYALEGFDRQMGAPVSEREAVYTNLGPGPYRFRLLATNAAGEWAQAEAELRFEIEPLFWQTWWFRAGLVSLCCLLVLGLYQYRLRGITRQMSIRFEERLQERTRIAQELHDTLLQGFQSASMQLHVAADQLGEDSPAKPRLGRALEVIEQVLEEGRHAVQGLRSMDAATRELGMVLARIPGELDLGENVAFDVHETGTPQRLHPLLRDELYWIGREALVNAFRHSRANRIVLELNYGRREFCLRVRDHGCGMEPLLLANGKPGHWGLAGMRERAERAGARLRLTSRLQEGTEVEVVVPAGVAYEQAARGDAGWKFWKRGRSL